MLRTSKPRNARSKRALEARAPREHEAAKKAIFVRGPHSSDKVALAFRDLAALKKPDAIHFAKKNDCLPFEEAGASSLEFWAGKNDTSLFVVGNTQKKRKDNLAFARIFDGHVLDIIEMGVLEGKGISEFKSPFAPSLGARPLFHFSGPHFSPDASAADSDASFSGALAMCNHGVHASFQHLKSMFLDFYRGEESPPGSGPGAVPGASGNQVSLRDGLQHIVCVTEGPEPAAQAPVSDNKELAELYAAGAAQTREGSSSIDNSAAGRTVYFRVYAPRPSGRSAGGAPTMELVEVGPSFDFVLRRRQPADSARLAASLKRPKTAAEKNTQGKTKRKNVETDDMGDMIGRVHMEKQDLGKLQTRKMKGLKPGREPAAAGGDAEMEGDDDDDSEPGFLEDSDEELIFEGSEGDEGLDADDDDAHLDDEMAELLETAGEVEAPKKKARK